MSISLKKDKWLLLGSLFVVSVLLLLSRFFYTDWKTARMITLPIPNCDLSQGPCSSSLPTGERVELRIKNTHLPVLTPVQLEVKTEQIPIKKILINFKGVEMNMGEFQLTLQPQQGGNFSAQTILPTCVSDHMKWHVIVNIETSHKQYVAPFVLVNQKPTSVLR